ncbi:potassium voltage-gated channel subfamily E member 3 isoform 1-T4 [Macrochelys suwanniensis]
MGDALPQDIGLVDPCGLRPSCPSSTLPQSIVRAKHKEPRHRPDLTFPGSCENMEVGNLTETWYQSLHSMLKALNQTLHGAILCPPDQATGQTNGSQVKLASKDDYSYMYILFVMILFAATVGSLILGYTKSGKVDKRSDPYHVYIKDRVSMI